MTTDNIRANLPVLFIIYKCLYLAMYVNILNLVVFTLICRGLPFLQSAFTKWVLMEKILFKFGVKKEGGKLFYGFKDPKMLRELYLPFLEGVCFFTYPMADFYMFRAFIPVTSHCR